MEELTKQVGRRREIRRGLQKELEIEKIRVEEIQEQIKHVKNAINEVKIDKSVV